MQTQQEKGLTSKGWRTFLGLDLPHPRTVLIVIGLLFLVGCRIVVHVPEGGQVMSDQGLVCSAGESCEIDVADMAYTESFEAVASPGYAFSHWKTSIDGLCGGTSGACTISLGFMEPFPSQTEMFDGDTTSYLQPIFVPADADGDGTVDSIDSDDDNDTIPDALELTTGRDPLVADWMIDAGGHHNCALIDGAVTCWGYNNWGQTTVPALSNPQHISGGRNHSCAIDDTGVVCWGNNEHGQAPALVAGLVSPRMVGAGFFHGCVLDDNGVQCWGHAGRGKLAVPPLVNPRRLTAGAQHSCALDDTGVVCWGDNTYGQTSVPALSNPVSVSAGGALHTCAVDDAGVQCWGANESGQRNVPLDLVKPWAVATGASHTCAIDAVGVRCWGLNNTGQSAAPALRNPVAISLGFKHSCALDDSGVVCWGMGSAVQTNFLGLPLDKDLDGLLDSVEDANANGIVDAGETDPLDTDSDGLADPVDPVDPVDPSLPQLVVISHNDQDTVSRAGFLLSGSASDDIGIQQVTASLTDSVQGDVFNDRLLSVSPNSGNWALPVEPVTAGGQLQLTIVVRDFEGQESSKTLELNVTEAAGSVEHMISRITFGATPELLDETRGQGADSFKAQQLDWASIDDSELESMLAAYDEPTSLFELQKYQLTSAIFSKRQLLEKMAWFWDNHFNTDQFKTGSPASELEENRRFRTHALGKFRDLLQVSATSPVMLVYLDNRTNIREEPNENYARELMELHTLGVEGGYSEKDVSEVARVLTGWSLGASPQGPEFRIFDENHDTGKKTVLGHTFGSDSAMADGNQLLDILASHPATATHICSKLLQYFVADVPASGSVNGCAAVFQSSDGDIAEVVAWILDSPAFNHPQAFKSKVKTPIEYLVSMIRGLSPSIASYKFPRRYLIAMGMDTFRCEDPTGWPEVGADWINSDQINERVRVVNQLLFSSPGTDTLLVEDLKGMFLSRGLESEDAVLGRMAELTLSGRYSGTEWEEARKALNDGSTGFDIHADDADHRLRVAISVMLNAPEYHLQ